MTDTPTGIPPSHAGVTPAIPADATAVLEMRFATGQLHRLRQAVALRTRACGADPAEVATAVLIASELAVNVMLHARSPGHIRLWHAGHNLWCQVSDTGPGIADPTSAGTVAPRPGKPRKRGLWIVSMVAADVSIDSRPGATTVTARMRIKQPRTPDARSTATGDNPTDHLPNLPGRWSATTQTHDGLDVAVVDVDSELTLDTAPNSTRSWPTSPAAPIGTSSAATGARADRRRYDPSLRLGGTAVQTFTSGMRHVLVLRA